MDQQSRGTIRNCPIQPISELKCAVTSRNSAKVVQFGVCYAFGTRCLCGLRDRGHGMYKAFSQWPFQIWKHGPACYRHLALLESCTAFPCHNSAFAIVVVIVVVTGTFQQDEIWSGSLSVTVHPIRVISYVHFIIWSLDFIMPIGLFSIWYSFLLNSQTLALELDQLAESQTHIRPHQN